jgi:hypothetical protein
MFLYGGTIFPIHKTIGNIFLKDYLTKKEYNYICTTQLKTTHGSSVATAFDL